MFFYHQIDNINPDLISVADLRDNITIEPLGFSYINI